MRTIEPVGTWRMRNGEVGFWMPLMSSSGMGECPLLQHLLVMHSGHHLVQHRLQEAQQLPILLTDNNPCSQTLMMNVVYVLIHMNPHILHFLLVVWWSRECFRKHLCALNMFPDNHTKFEGISNTKRAFFMGNALVVGVIEKIGAELYNQINQ